MNDKDLFSDDIFPDDEDYVFQSTDELGIDYLDVQKDNQNTSSDSSNNSEPVEDIPQERKIVPTIVRPMPDKFIKMFPNTTKIMLVNRDNSRLIFVRG